MRLKMLATVLTLASLSACSWFQSKDDETPSTPREREEFVVCTDSPQPAECVGKYKSGKVCKPSLEHHSLEKNCPYKK